MDYVENTFIDIPTAKQLLDWAEATYPGRHAPLGELEVDDDLERIFGKFNYTNTRWLRLPWHE